MKADPPALRDSGAAACAALLEGLPEAAWLVDLAGLRVVAANTAAAALFGRPTCSLVGEAASALPGSPEDLAYWAEDAGGEPGRQRRCACGFRRRKWRCGRRRWRRL